MASVGYVLAFFFFHQPVVCDANLPESLRLEQASLITVELCELGSSRPLGSHEVLSLTKAGLQCPCIVLPSCFPVFLVKANHLEVRLN